MTILWCALTVFLVGGLYFGMVTDPGNRPITGLLFLGVLAGAIWLTGWWALLTIPLGFVVGAMPARQVFKEQAGMLERVRKLAE